MKRRRVILLAAGIALLVAVGIVWLRTARPLMRVTPVRFEASNDNKRQFAFAKIHSTGKDTFVVLCLEFATGPASNHTVVNREDMLLLPGRYYTNFTFLPGDGSVGTLRVWGRLLPRARPRLLRFAQPLWDRYNARRCAPIHFDSEQRIVAPLYTNGVLASPARVLPPGEASAVAK